MRFLPLSDDGGMLAVEEEVGGRGRKGGRLPGILWEHPRVERLEDRRASAKDRRYTQPSNFPLVDV